MGGGEKDLKNSLKSKYQEVRVVKPLASRKESSEAYFVCLSHVVARSNTNDKTSVELGNSH